MKLKYPCLLVTALSLLAFAASVNADGVTISTTSPASTATGGATLSLTSGTLTLTGTGGTTTGGTVFVTSPGTSTTTGAGTAVSSGTLTLTGSGSTTTGGTVVVSNPGTSTSTGTGTVTSTGTLTLTGAGATTTGGTVITSTPPGASTGTGTITITDPGTLNIGGTGVTANPGTSTSTGIGTITLTGTGTITGFPTGTNTLTLSSDASVLTSLSTAGHHFSISMTGPPAGPPGTAMPMFIMIGPLAFNASFVLANHTTTDMSFTVPRPNVPMGAMPIFVPNVVFRIYDHTEKLIWESWTNPGSMKLVPEILPAGSSWTQSALVPLLVNGQWLSGKYVLVATVNGTPEYSATASFDVSPPQTLTSVTGIKGLAVEGPMTAVFAPGNPNEMPLAAVIDISGPQWTGPVPSTAMIAVPVRHVKSDSKGHFSVGLPPGTYQVTGESPNPSAPFPKSSPQTVTVVAGHMTEVIVKYATGIP